MNLWIDEDRMVLVRSQQCIWCGGTSLLRLNSDDLTRWIRGAYVQDVWPEKTPEQREVIMTGTHPYCWDEMFSEQEGA